MEPGAWVFGYGSLMWDPGFDPAETVTARLEGYARSFCMLSTQYRGTPERPGLVLALDAEAGAHCTGLAFRIPDADRDAVMAYLRERELITDAYAEAEVAVTLADGRRVTAVAYVIRHEHEQYAGHLDLCEQAAIIAQSHGMRGPNADYLFNTARHLTQIGLADAHLDALSLDVQRLLDAARKNASDGTDS